MSIRLMVVLAILGIMASIVSVVAYSKKVQTSPPLKVAYNPYEKGVYANGIVESYQDYGTNVNVVPEVSGTITDIYVREGQTVHPGDALFKIDDTVQRELVEQLKAQEEASLQLLKRLKSEPRKETLEVSLAQKDYAKAVLEDKRLQWDKIHKAFLLNPKSVSKDDLDKAQKAYEVAQKSYEVALKQYQLVKAGSWDYEIKQQEAQHRAAQKAYEGALKTLEKYTVKALSEGVVAKIQISRGSFVSPQGAYEPYTKSYNPAVVITNIGNYMQVRCYIDEILIHQFPEEKTIQAVMFPRGSDKKIPLEYVRTEPYVIPKVQLSSGKTERVDLRVLPVIFRFSVPQNTRIYPGQLVDVYIGENQPRPSSGVNQ